MITQITRSPQLVWFLLLAPALLACGRWGPRPLPPPVAIKPPPAPPVPEEIKIALRLEDYRVVDQRVLTEIAPLEKLKFAGTRKIGEAVFIRLEAVPKREDFWLGQVPPVRSGECEVTATRISIKDPPPPPPPIIRIHMVIEGREVKDQRIENFGSGTVGVHLAGTRRSPDGKVCILESPLYDGVTWEFVLPKKDGVFEVQAVRR
jgi:hypothetical protein